MSIVFLTFYQILLTNWLYNVIIFLVIKMTIYERIRYLREQQGMSQQDLADKVGYKTASAVNKIELGLRDLNQSKIILFSKALGVTPAYLMDGQIESVSVPESEIDQEIIKVFNRLSEEKQKQALDYLSYLASQK